jgi:hypothetical protein
MTRELSGLLAAILIGLFIWHVVWLNECRNYNSYGALGAYSFIKEGCPTRGPYSPNSNVFVYALFHLFYN